MVAASEVKFELLQQVQASVPFSFIIWQLATIPLKVSIELTQADTFKRIIFFNQLLKLKKRKVYVLTSVMLGKGMFSVAQAILTLASQPLRSLARSVKFFAPLLVVEPWQVSALESPPPDLVNINPVQSCLIGCNQSWLTSILINCIVHLIKWKCQLFRIFNKKRLHNSTRWKLFLINVFT